MVFAQRFFAIPVCFPNQIGKREYRPPLLFRGNHLRSLPQLTLNFPEPIGLPLPNFRKLRHVALFPRHHATHTHKHGHRNVEFLRNLRSIAEGIAPTIVKGHHDHFLRAVIAQAGSFFGAPARPGITDGLGQAVQPRALIGEGRGFFVVKIERQLGWGDEGVARTAQGHQLFTQLAHRGHVGKLTGTDAVIEQGEDSPLRALIFEALQ